MAAARSSPSDPTSMPRIRNSRLGLFTLGRHQRNLQIRRSVLSHRGIIGKIKDAASSVSEFITDAMNSEPAPPKRAGVVSKKAVAKSPVKKTPAKKAAANRAGPVFPGTARLRTRGWRHDVRFGGSCRPPSIDRQIVRPSGPPPGSSRSCGLRGWRPLLRTEGPLDNAAWATWPSRGSDEQTAAWVQRSTVERFVSERRSEAAAD
jgi:hypothetical protein